MKFMLFDMSDNWGIPVRELKERLSYNDLLEYSAFYQVKQEMQKEAMKDPNKNKIKVSKDGKNRKKPKRTAQCK